MIDRFPIRSSSLPRKALCLLVLAIVASGLIGVVVASTHVVGEHQAETDDPSRFISDVDDPSIEAVTAFLVDHSSDSLGTLGAQASGEHLDQSLENPNETRVTIGSVCTDGEDSLSAAARRLLANSVDCLRETDGPGQEPGTAQPAGHVEVSDYDEPVDVEREVSHEIPFRTGTVVPEPGVGEAVIDGIAEKNGRSWVLVQFESVPTPEQFQSIRGDGFVLGYTLSPNSFYVGIPSERIDAVAEREYVRSITTIRPEWKSAPEIWDRAEISGETVLVTVESMTWLDVDGLELIADHAEEGAYLYRGEIPRGLADHLREDPSVVWIEPYRRPSTEVAEGRRIAAVPSAVQNPGYAPALDGSGVVVGVADSTFATGHPHFSGVSIETAARMGSQPVNASDCGSHGTHVAGTIAGQGTDTRGTTQRGVAPEVDLVLARILSTGSIRPNQCDWNNLIRGPKWVFNQVHDQNSDVAVISNSWGFGMGGYYVTPTRVTDKWARDHEDTLLVFSNGNNNQWVGIPANAKNVLSVGALYDGSDPRATYSEVDDVLDSPSFNADNSTRDDEHRGSNRRKPEVYAPGMWTVAPVEVDGSTNTYQRKRGTSMAAPHVSGIAALYKQVHPNANANEIRAALVGTTTPPQYNGYGVVDANNAIFDNRFERTQDHFTATVYQGGPTPTRNITVGPDAEQLVVSAAWMDIQGNPAVSNDNILKRNINVELHGPNGTHRYNWNTTNVKKITVDDPHPGEWELEISPKFVVKDCFWKQWSDPCNTIDVEAMYRVVTEEPTLSVETPDRVTLTPGASSNNVVFDLNVSGTGAPVGGINAQIEGMSGLTACNPEPDEPNDRLGYVFGSLSHGYNVTQSLCFQVPDQYGTYPVQIDVNSENANRTTITKTVYIEYRPQIELDPHTHEVLPGEWDVYDVLVRGVDDGIGTARFTFTQNNTNVGTFRNGSIVATHDTSRSTVSVDPAGDWMAIEAVGMDTVDSGTATIATIAMKGDRSGITNITVEPVVLENESAAATAGLGHPGRFESGGTLPPAERGELHVGAGPPVDRNTSLEFVPTTPAIEFDPTTGFSLSISNVTTEYVAAEPVWEFGDGSVGQGYSVEYTHAEDGEYEVAATLIGPDGVMTRLTRPIAVNAEADGVAITDVSVPSTADPGETIAIAATVANDRAEGSTVSVVFLLNGEVIRTSEVELGAGEHTAVTAEAILPEAEGEHEIGVRADQEETFASVTVDLPGDDGSGDGTEPPPDDSENEALPGPGPIGAIVAILLGGSLFARRSR